MLTRKERIYAICKSIYFGVLPSWFYEKECHYIVDGEAEGVKTYLGHLWLNMLIIKSLVLKTEHTSTHRFHRMKIKKWFRWQYK